MNDGANGSLPGVTSRWRRTASVRAALTSTCTTGAPAATLHDAYRALEFLVQLPSVDPDRVAVIGFSQGGWLALNSVERGFVERTAKDKFRAAIAFYPPCLGFKDSMTVPTLILVGELDDWTLAKECRNLAEGRDDYGISRQKGEGVPIELMVLAGAYHDFDIPEFADSGTVSRASSRIQPGGPGSSDRRVTQIPVCDDRPKRELAMTINAVVFDAYGTLYDVQSVAAVTEDVFPAMARSSPRSGASSSSNIAGCVR